MAAPTLDGNSLGNVDSIQFTKNSNIQVLPLPQANSSSAILLDAFGPDRIISINGTFADTTANVKTSVDNILGIIDGTQSSTVNLVTDEIGTVAVMVMSFDVTWLVPSNRATYVLKLVEGSAI